MQLTRHTDFALRVLMYLGIQHNRQVSVAEIAEFYSISRNHLVKVVQGLTEHGFVTTNRGKNGGMQLAVDANKISIGNVVRNMENHFEIVECFDSKANKCKIENACKLKGLLQQAIDNFLLELDGYTLADVIKPGLRKNIVNFSARIAS